LDRTADRAQPGAAAPAEIQGAEGVRPAAAPRAPGNDGGIPRLSGPIRRPPASSQRSRPVARASAVPWNLRLDSHTAGLGYRVDDRPRAPPPVAGSAGP